MICLFHNLNIIYEETAAGHLILHLHSLVQNVLHHNFDSIVVTGEPISFKPKVDSI